MIFYDVNKININCKYNRILRLYFFANYPNRNQIYGLSFIIGGNYKSGGALQIKT